MTHEILTFAERRRRYIETVDQYVRITAPKSAPPYPNWREWNRIEPMCAVAAHLAWAEWREKQQ